MSNLIPYSTQNITDSDIRAVTQVLKSPYLTQGPKIEEFEAAIANYVGAEFCVAFSNATAALHCAMLASKTLFGIDRVVTSPNTFVATSNAALYCDIQVEFSDIDPNTGNLDQNCLGQEYGQNTAIVPVHFSGLACELPPKISQNNVVIEDASHALGATQSNGKMVGSCTDSLAAVFSFHPVKMITTGEGGCVTTNNKELFVELTRLRSHGINKGNDPYVNPGNAYHGGKLNPWYYEMQTLGFNYRMTEIQAALGLSQLSRLDSFVQSRRSVAKVYDSAFANHPNVHPIGATGRDISSLHLYVLAINFDAIGKSRSELMTFLRANGIGSQVHYIPVPMQPYYEQLGYGMDSLTGCQSYYSQCLSIPCYPQLNSVDQSKVIDRLLEFCR